MVKKHYSGDEEDAGYYEMTEKNRQYNEAAGAIIGGINQIHNAKPPVQDDYHGRARPGDNFDLIYYDTETLGHERPGRRQVNGKWEDSPIMVNSAKMSDASVIQFGFRRVSPEGQIINKDTIFMQPPTNMAGIDIIANNDFAKQHFKSRIDPSKPLTDEEMAGWDSRKIGMRKMFDALGAHPEREMRFVGMNNNLFDDVLFTKMMNEAIRDGIITKNHPVYKAYMQSSIMDKNGKQQLRGIDIYSDLKKYSNNLLPEGNGDINPDRDRIHTMADGTELFMKPGSHRVLRRDDKKGFKATNKLEDITRSLVHKVLASDPTNHNARYVQSLLDSDQAHSAEADIVFTQFVHDHMQNFLESPGGQLAIAGKGADLTGNLFEEKPLVHAHYHKEKGAMCRKAKPGEEIKDESENGITCKECWELRKARHAIKNDHWRRITDAGRSPALDTQERWDKRKGNTSKPIEEEVNTTVKPDSLPVDIGQLTTLYDTLWQANKMYARTIVSINQETDAFIKRDRVQVFLKDISGFKQDVLSAIKLANTIGKGAT